MKALRSLTFFLLLAAGLSAQQQIKPSANNRGFRIAGTVISSVTGQPVASASVAVAPTSQGEERDIARSVVTATDGRFYFDNLSRGKYSLMATAHGYSLQYFEHHDPYATAVAVGPDLDSEQLVFRMDPDAAIEGQVLDENNDPVDGAMVRLFRSSVEEGLQKTTQENTARTDDQGHYHIGHLSPGKYYLTVSARPWYAQNIRASGPQGTDEASTRDAASLDLTYPLTFYPDSADSSAATALLVNAGERTTADVVLRSTPSLHLRIHTAGSAETPHLGGMAFPHLSQRVFDGYLESVDNAPVSWVAPGVVEVSGLAPGHYIVEMPAANNPGEKGSGRGWYREIDLTNDMELNASDAPNFASVSGSVNFEGEPRVPRGLSLQIINPDTREGFRADISDTGEFDFSSDAVRPGRYMVTLENARGFFLKQITSRGARSAGRYLEIGGAGNVHVNAIAARGVGRVDGTAVRDDKPYSGAMVVLVPNDLANSWPLFRRDQSDGDGTFTLPNVVPGQYTVVAIANGWDLEWASPAVLQPYLKRGEPVQVPVDGKLQIKVQVQ